MSKKFLDRIASLQCEEPLPAMQTVEGCDLRGECAGFMLDAGSLSLVMDSRAIYYAALRFTSALCAGPAFGEWANGSGWVPQEKMSRLLAKDTQRVINFSRHIRCSRVDYRVVEQGESAHPFISETACSWSVIESLDKKKETFSFYPMPFNTIASPVSGALSVRVSYNDLFVGSFFISGACEIITADDELFIIEQSYRFLQAVGFVASDIIVKLNKMGKAFKGYESVVEGVERDSCHAFQYFTHKMLLNTEFHMKRMFVTFPTQNTISLLQACVAASDRVCSAKLVKLALLIKNSSQDDAKRLRKDFLHFAIQLALLQNCAFLTRECAYVDAYETLRNYVIQRTPRLGVLSIYKAICEFPCKYDLDRKPYDAKAENSDEYDAKAGDDDQEYANNCYVKA